MRMLVLAGGFGTRLKSVVDDVPKPLAPVGEAPFLKYQIEHWVSQGMDSFVFLLHHQADLINQFLVGCSESILSRSVVESITEPQPLGTGGAVAYAVHEFGLKGEFMVVNADTWLGSGIRELSQVGADAIAVVSQRDVYRFGQVELDDDGFVSAFREKGGCHGEGWISAGMSILSADHFKDWQGGYLSLEKEIFPNLIVNRKLRAVQLKTDFIDIGVPEDYRRFCRWQENKREGELCS